MATEQETGAKRREIEAELRSLDAAEREIMAVVAPPQQMESPAAGPSDFSSAAADLGSKIFESSERLAKIRADRDKLHAEIAKLQQLTDEAPEAPSPAVTPGSPPPIGPGRHPILDVEGQFARATEVIDLTLANNEFAFSDTLRAGLTAACGDKLRLTGDNEPIIGIGNFLRGCLAQTARNYRPERPPFSLAEAIVAFLIQQGDAPPTLERLQGLIGTDMPPNFEASVVDPGLTRVLSAAARLVQEMTPGQIRVDMRHVLIAALKTPQAQRLFHRIDVAGPSPDLFFADLFDEVKNHVLSHATGVQGHFDDREAASSAIDALEYLPEAAPPQPLQRSAVHFAGDRELETKDEDKLGVADEARALAEVICLREPGPPLAVGLFGDWGSGKSSFMNLLRGAINDLTGKVNPDDAAAATMVQKVVHVKFNAWHYNDANLWASITTEFFVQLRAGGFDKAAGLQYSALVNAVAERVAQSDREADTQKAAVTAAQKKIGTLKDQLAELRLQRSDATSTALGEAVSTLIDDISRLSPDRVKEAMTLLGQPLDLPPGKENAEEILKAVGAKRESLTTELATAASIGKVGLIWRGARKVFAARDWLSLLLVMLIVGFSVATVAAILLVDHKTFTAWFGAAAVASALGTFLRIYRSVRPIVRAVTKFNTVRREKLENIDTQLATKRDDIAATEVQLVTAEASRSASENEAMRFRGGSPDQLLDWLLNVSDETRRFEKELGTISQVRRLFEQLDAIFTERTKLKKKVEKPDLTDEERRRTEKKLDVAQRVTYGIDRIVLYIDDLDRCNAKQVVKVLEAVHLLLAFKLFVVVVGVDARWLKHALLKVYQKELHDSGRSKQGQVDRASEQDYLEKIFQVPFHLKPLRGGTYFNAFLLSVAGPVARPAGGSNPPSPRQAEPVNAGGRRTITPLDIKVEEETIQETVERVTLQEAELKQIEQLSTLLAKSPRAVKRFMNVYRLIRGLKRGPDLAAFLGGAGRAGTYPAVLFWLAVRLGLSPEEARYFRAAVLQLQPEAKSAAELRLFLTMPQTPTGRSTSIFLKSVLALRRVADSKTIEDCCSALEAVVGVFPAEEALQILAEAEQETLRFTLEGA
jgi:ABC-type multidrug transport system fused ATPase/permease subunit